MPDNMKVFVVDDDPAARLMTRAQVEQHGFLAQEFGDAAACLAAMDEMPDILLLDVEMPGMDGIALCRALRAAGNDAVQVVFVSAHSGLETRLQAYDAGGNDYIVKPYQPEELVRKLRVARQTLAAVREMALQADSARRTAFAAMSSMGEMGITLDFLRSSFVCQTVEELGIALCGAVAQYELQCLVKLSVGGESHFFSSAGECTPLEASILGNVQNMERIFQFKNRLAINYPLTTLLVSNLPLADPDRVGRLRDHLTVLAEGADMRLAAMSNEFVRMAQAQSVAQAAGELTRTLEEIQLHQQQHRAEMLNIIDDQQMAMERAFVHMGLTPRQEDALVAMAKETAAHVGRIQDVSLSVGTRLRAVTDSLRDIVAPTAGVEG